MTENSFQGVRYIDGRTKFCVYSPKADKLELCLFSKDETKETKIPMQKNDDGFWSVAIDGKLEGQKYGYRSHGVFDPDNRLFFNPNKLLVDPYALEVTKSLHDITNKEKEILLGSNDVDSKDVAPKSIVRFLDKEELSKQFPYLYKKPNLSWSDVHIYELHVGNFTKLHPDISDEKKGRLEALEETINYFKSLSYNQIELMPITPTMADWQLDVEKGLSDQWGYNPINHHAIDPRYGNIYDFLSLVNAFHKNGIEVSLDLVYNHTGEFGKDAFLLSYKGLDADSYYRFSPQDNSSFVNTTGCKNGFNPYTIEGAKIIKNSLMFFADICGVDAFRFDLAGDCCLDNELHFNKDSIFVKTIEEVAAITNAKMSGEPWSAVGGYFLGQIPSIQEWNDKHEKSLKRFMRGEFGQINSLAHYLAGGDGDNKVNIFTKHDGATGHDWATYSEKNNYENNENNNDGTNENLYSPSQNDEEKLRKTKSAHAINTLARGVPLSLYGDELWRSQNGNNNGYAKSFPLVWKGLSKEQRERYLFERKINAFRQAHPIFSTTKKANSDIMANNKPSWEWVNVNGCPMTNNDWEYPQNRFLGYILNGEDEKAHRFDDDFLVMISGSPFDDINVVLPTPPHEGKWELVFDTSKTTKKEALVEYNEKDVYAIKPQSVVVLTCRRKKYEKEKDKTNILNLKNNLRFGAKGLEL